MNKLIILDFFVYLHKAGYSPSEMPVNYDILSMIIGNLKLIGVRNGIDTVIVAVDGRDSWRKKYEETYKEGREELRQKSGKDWKKIYHDGNDLLEQLDIAGLSVFRYNHIEADDIMAIFAKYINDKEIILCTHDSDLEQLWTYPNVKILSPAKKTQYKYKIKPENYNPYKVISKKIMKEASDGLTKEISGEEDYYNRKLCIDLLSLPEFIEAPLLEEIKKINFGRKIYPELIPFNGLRSRWDKVFDLSCVVSYEDCIKHEERKKNRTKKKK